MNRHVKHTNNTKTTSANGIMRNVNTKYVLLDTYWPVLGHMISKYFFVIHHIERLFLFYFYFVVHKSKQHILIYHKNDVTFIISKQCHRLTQEINKTNNMFSSFPRYDKIWHLELLCKIKQILPLLISSY